MSGLVSYEHNEDPLRMALGVICLTIAALFASAGGIGGGGMLVPICMVVLDFDFSTSVILSLTTVKARLSGALDSSGVLLSHPAIALAYDITVKLISTPFHHYIVCGNCLAQWYINSDKRHPLNSSRPLVYYDAMVLLLPSQLAGANFGVLIEHIFPPAVLVVVAMVVLLFAGTKLLQKGMRLWGRETVYMKEEEEIQEQEKERIEKIANSGPCKNIDGTDRMSLNNVAALSMSRNSERVSNAGRESTLGELNAVKQAIQQREQQTNQKLNQNHNQRTFSKDSMNEGSIMSTASASVRERIHSRALDGQEEAKGLDNIRTLSTADKNKWIENLGDLGDFEINDSPNDTFGTGTGTGTGTGIEKWGTNLMGNPLTNPLNTGGNGDKDSDGDGDGDIGMMGENGNEEIRVRTQSTASVGSYRESITSQSVANPFSNLKAKTLLPISWPKEVIYALVTIWFTYLAFLVAQKEFVSPCSSGYYILLFSGYVPVAVVTIWGVMHISKRQRSYPDSVMLGDMLLINEDSNRLEDEENKTMPSNSNNSGGGSGISIPSISSISKKQDSKQHQQQENETRRCNPQLLSPLVAFCVGVMCSLLGIGGGELMGPLMLGLGLLPQVSSATTSAMSVFNSLLNVVHYGIRGSLNLEWVATTFSIGVVGGVLGRKLSLYITVTYGRPSITVFMLSAVLFTSVAMLVDRLLQENDFSDFEQFCSP